MSQKADGYFICKRHVQDSFDGRLQVLDEKLETLRKEQNYTGIALVMIEKDIIEKMRSHFRNSLLWDTKND